MSEGHAPVLDNSDFKVNDLTCKSDDPPQEPEVLVDVWQGAGTFGEISNTGADPTFVRIPTTEVELWINKDGPSDLNRTAKVKFPGEWGGIDIQQFINGFNALDDAPYDMCRIWHYDETNENYQITHFGYIGGVGPASETGVFKFWCYDPADLLKGVQVSQSWGEPTIARILDWAVRGNDDSGEPIGLENRTVFGQIAPIKTVLAGPAEVAIQKQDTQNVGTEDVEGGDIGIKIGPMNINFTDAVDDALDYILGTEVTNSIIGGQKSFKQNRHNVVDVLNWFAERVGGKWHFEPTPGGPVLFFDNTSASESPEFEDNDIARRYFVEKETRAIPNAEAAVPANDPDDLINKEIFDVITTLDNQALYDSKPFNKLVLLGESSNPTDYRSAKFHDAASASALGEAFPKVTVTYPPLIERANGYEYSKTVESDEVFLQQAKDAAKRTFRQDLEEETEGEMTIVGEPYILPYDFVVNIPVCERRFPNIDARPMRFEVNSVKHTRKAGERFKTRLGVSLELFENEIEVEAKYVSA